MKADRTTKLLLLVIAAGIWANVLWHPAAAKASEPNCAAAVSAAEDARSAARDAKNDVEKIWCYKTDPFANFALTDVRISTGQGEKSCLTLLDMESKLASRSR